MLILTKCGIMINNRVTESWSAWPPLSSATSNRGRHTRKREPRHENVQGKRPSPAAAGTAGWQPRAAGHDRQRERIRRRDSPTAVRSGAGGRHAVGPRQRVDCSDQDDSRHGTHGHGVRCCAGVRGTPRRVAQGALQAREGGTSEGHCLTPPSFAPHTHLFLV